MQWAHVQGAQIRAQLREALRLAGESGATSKALAAGIGNAQRNVRWYLSNTEGLALFAETRSRTLSRWFAPGLDAAAAAYVAECNKRESTKAPAGPRTLQAIVDAAIDGRTVDDICQATGNARRTVRKAIAALSKAGRVAAATWPSGSAAGGTVKRYWSIEHGAQQPPVKEPRKRVHVSRAKPAEQHKKRGRKAKPVEFVRSTRKPPVVASAPMPVIVPEHVKVTVCPSGKDHRFTVKHPTPFFAHMQLGSYMRTGSAIEAAYGGAR